MAALFAKTEPTRRPWDATILLQVHRLAATRPWRLPSAVYRGCTIGRGNWRDSQAGGGPSGTGSEPGSNARRCYIQGIISDGDSVTKNSSASRQSASATGSSLYLINRGVQVFARLLTNSGPPAPSGSFLARVMASHDPGQIV